MTERNLSDNLFCGLLGVCKVDPLIPVSLLSEGGQLVTFRNKEAAAMKYIQYLGFISGSIDIGTWKVVLIGSDKVGKTVAHDFVSVVHDWVEIRGNDY